MYFYALFALAMLLPLRAGYFVLFSWLILTVAAGKFLGLSLVPSEISFYANPIVLFFLAGIGTFHFYRLVPQPAAIKSGPYLNILVKAGDASYSTYLFHGFVLGPLVAGWTRLGLPGWLWPLFTLAAIMFCSAVGFDAAHGNRTARRKTGTWRTIVISVPSSTICSADTPDNPHARWCRKALPVPADQAGRSRGLISRAVLDCLLIAPIATHPSGTWLMSSFCSHSLSRRPRFEETPDDR
eukprot:gene58053-79516_t